MSSSSATGRSRSSSWQERLQDHCRSSQMLPPVFTVVSDRRGGRTAWSSTVTIPSPSSPSSQQTIQARYWYDGQFVYNAKEDAAEVALRVLTGGGRASAAGPSSPVSPSAGPSSPGYGQGGSGMGMGMGMGGEGSAMGGYNAGVGAAWPRSPPAGRW